MGYYASDGLPRWYYAIVRDAYEMADMRRRVFDAIASMDVDLIGEISAEEICELTEIHPIFIGEVDDFIEDVIDK